MHSIIWKCTHTLLSSFKTNSEDLQMRDRNVSVTDGKSVRAIVTYTYIICWGMKYWTDRYLERPKTNQQTHIRVHRRGEVTLPTTRLENPEKGRLVLLSIVISCYSVYETVPPLLVIPQCSFNCQTQPFSLTSAPIDALGV